MSVQSSNVAADFHLLSAVILAFLVLGFVTGLLLERIMRRKAQDVPRMPDIPNAGLLQHQAPLMPDLCQSLDAPMTLKSHVSGSSGHTAHFGGVRSLDRGEGSLEQPAVAESEPDIEAVPYLSADLPDAAEQVPYLNAATGKPCYEGSLAPTAGPESEGSFQSDDAGPLSVMDASQAAPYLEGTPTSGAVAVDSAEQMPYLNAATGKPCYTGGLAPTACAQAEGSFQSDDAVALSVLDASQAAPYLDGTPTSRAAVPYEAESAHASPRSPRRSVPVPYLK